MTDTSTATDGGVITLYADGLASKWGFCDGDIFDDVIYEAGCSGEWGQETLVHFVTDRLVPVIEADGVVLEVERIVTIHNPIRAKSVNGVEIDQFDCRDHPLLTQSVDVPVVEIVEHARSLAVGVAADGQSVEGLVAELEATGWEYRTTEWTHFAWNAVAMEPFKPRPETSCRIEVNAQTEAQALRMVLAAIHATEGRTVARGKVWLVETPNTARDTYDPAWACTSEAEAERACDAHNAVYGTDDPAVVSSYQLCDETTEYVNGYPKEGV